MKKTNVALALLMLSTSLPIAAASFDCNKASGYTELTICTTPALSALDEQLNALYQKVNQSNPDKVQLIKKSQLSWLKDVRNKATTAQDIKTAYTARINDLNMMLGQDQTHQANESTTDVESHKKTIDNEQPQPQPQPQPVQTEPNVTPEQIEAYRERLKEAMTEVGRRPGAMIYYCYDHNNEPKNRNALIGAFSQASKTNLLTGEALQYSNELYNILRGSYPNEVAKDYLAAALTINMMCNKMADLSLKNGWAV